MMDYRSDVFSTFQAGRFTVSSRTAIWRAHRRPFPLNAAIVRPRSTAAVAVADA